MSEADYPTLGFDPLPGHPDAVHGLIERTRSFSHRLTSMADYLQRLGCPEGWSGEAAEAFAAGVKPLAQDLRRFSQGAGELVKVMEQYKTRFVEAKGKRYPATGTFELEEQARQARNALFEAELAYDSPREAAPDRRALDKGLEEAVDNYGAVVRRARQYQPNFEASVEDLARAIHRLAERAPDHPMEGVVDWAERLFMLTPAGMAAAAMGRAHEGYWGVGRRASALGRHLRTDPDKAVRSAAGAALGRVGKTAKFARTGAFRALGAGVAAVGVVAELPDTFRESRGDTA